ncbi:hypothetical protein AALO_G00123430 [Alosa alosa]|uniref:Helicase ATP-binding domain-containing protein n=1 Tax=Alosa alosa TaxID=278164 RepID=A0AAV6GP22_9TELE|nr:hypothetical protein AALO_G00123430 [Alosa alosa]
MATDANLVCLPGQPHRLDLGLVVDEVHVTYKWGEAAKGESPFRESFAKLGELRSITKEGTLALTASADIKSRNRVRRILHMDNCIQIIASPNKGNIQLGLCMVPSNELNCFDWLVQRVKDKGCSMQPVLVYCQTLKMVGSSGGTSQSRAGGGAHDHNFTT